MFREDPARQETRVFREHRDDALQHEPLCDGPVLVARNDLVEDRGHLVRRTASDSDAIVVEEWLPLVREKEVEGLVSFREVLQRDHVDWLVELEIEVVDPEFAEVAEDDVPWPMGYEALPILECLTIVALKRLATFFHFNQKSWFPDKIGETRAFLVLLHPVLQGGARLLVSGMTKGLKQPVTKDLRLPLLIAPKRLRVLHESVKAGCFLGTHQRSWFGRHGMVSTEG